MIWGEGAGGKFENGFNFFLEKGLRNFFLDFLRPPPQIINGSPLRLLMGGQMDRQTDGCYQTYHLPCFAVDNDKLISIYNCHNT